MWTVELLVVATMIAVNSIFAAYEIALASIGLARLDTLKREHRTGAAAALRMKENTEASLAVVQLGITLVGAVAAATGGAGAEESIEPILRNAGLSDGTSQVLAIAIVVLPLTALTIIFGELVPKVFALRNKEWVCLRLSPAMEWFAWCVWPIVRMFESSVSGVMALAERIWKPDHRLGAHEAGTLQELRGIAALARMSRLIGQREEGIILSAARLASTKVSAIMLPVDHISLLYLEDSLADAMIKAHLDMHTRFPVAEKEGDPQSIVGYVNFKDIVAMLRFSPQEPSLRGVLRPLPGVSAKETVARALEQLIRDHHHIAVVKDDAGGIVGMITMEDILEELVGEIHDEYDRLPAHITPSGSGWVVGGNVGLERLREATGVNLPTHGERPAHNVSEWVVRHLGEPPHGGEIVTVDDVRMVVRKVRRHHVQELHIGRIKPVGAGTK